MTMPAMAQAASVRRDELEVSIDAPLGRVWEALTTEMHEWWRPDFFAAKRTQRLVFEPRVGGRLYEDTGDGHGLLWYTVYAIEPRKSIDLVGHIASRFGGPTVSMLYLVLEAKGDATILKISDSRVGYIADCDVAAGWRLLFGEGLKPWVEGRR